MRLRLLRPGTGRFGAVLTTAVAGAPIIDAHVHVIGDGLSHPYAPEVAYRPTPASVQDLVAVHDRFGIGRAVLVQVSVHGIDNSLLLESLELDPQRFRGVAVVDPNPGDDLLRRFRDAGVVGLRLNLAHSGGPGEAALSRYGAICREMDWHLQVYAEGQRIAALASHLSRQHVTLVLDHFGGVPAEALIDDRGRQSVLGLVGDGAWIKLSAPYRLSAQREGFSDVLGFGAALRDLAPDRCVWASDWPHVAVPDKLVDVATMVGWADRVAGSGADLAALLWKNAERLYGFTPIEP